MAKRLFEILDEMNHDDAKNGTRLVSISNNFISADKIKAGTKVAMGCDDQVLTELIDGTHVPLLIIVNKKEYEKRSK